LQTLNASFERVAAMLLRGQVKPLPALVYDFSEIATALRQFSTAKHVGKIVVKVPATVDVPKVSS
jgi:NADPH:quinone reductase-like Zn-dependent oxidoreductase